VLAPAMSQQRNWSHRTTYLVIAGNCGCMDMAIPSRCHTKVDNANHAEQTMTATHPHKLMSSLSSMCNSYLPPETRPSSRTRKRRRL
jgi:hypothetical protein